MKLWPPEEKEEVYLRLITHNDGDSSVYLVGVNDKGDTFDNGFILGINPKGKLILFEGTSVPGIASDNEKKSILFQGYSPSQPK